MQEFPAEPWLRSSLGGPELVPSQNMLKTPMFPLTSTAALFWHPRPLPGLRELISEHRKEAIPVWAERAKRARGWNKKSWKPPAQRDSTDATMGRGKSLRAGTGAQGASPLSVYLRQITNTLQILVPMT